MSSSRLANLRDLGCLPLEGGGRTRGGVLYRSDAPYDGDGSPGHVVGWPPSTVIDLRSPREAERWPFAWPRETVVRNHSLHEGARPDRLPEDADLVGLYATILDESPHLVAALLADVAEARGPVLVHCAAGKDRTGIVVAALLLAAAVERSAVVADYLATERNMDALRRRWAAQGVFSASSTGLQEAWLASPVEAISLVVDRITGWPGGARGWWLDHGAEERHLEVWREKIRPRRRLAIAV